MIIVLAKLHREDKFTYILMKENLLYLIKLEGDWVLDDGVASKTHTKTAVPAITS